MKKTKLRYDRIAIFLVIIIIIIISIIFGIKHIIYTHSYEYKFLKLGYNNEETNYLLTISNDKKDYILSLDYEDKIVEIMKQKYFLWKNLTKYLDYYKNNNNKNLEDIIAIINVKANNNWYDEQYINETNITNKYQILVNKFNYLPDNYDKTIEIEKISNWYSYGNEYIEKETYQQFIKMFNAAKEENLTLIINSGYRTNQEQKELYEERYESQGIEEADKYAARPKFSEHETGLAIDVFTPNYATTESFENSDEYKWLINNSYKYGFILRYPKDKEYLTGYNYESWHFRYLGKELASKVYSSGLTYDEYYAYYIEGNEE